MTDHHTLMAAISQAVLNAEDDHRNLLQSVVHAARAIFGAAASSIFLLDALTGELVFEAVSGAGEESLVGSRFPASQGIAGWVLDSTQPVIVNDVADDPRFARDFAESTQYVPKAIMAAPVMCDEDAIGVLEVLDAGPSDRSPLVQLELLSLFAVQAAAALRIVQRSRAARGLLLSTDSELADLVEVVRILDTLDGERRQAGLKILGSMRMLLAG